VPVSGVTNRSKPTSTALSLAALRAPSTEVGSSVTEPRARNSSALKLMSCGVLLQDPSPDGPTRKEGEPLTRHGRPPAQRNHLKRSQSRVRRQAQSSFRISACEPNRTQG